MYRSICLVLLGILFTCFVGCSKPVANEAEAKQRLEDWATLIQEGKKPGNDIGLVDWMYDHRSTFPIINPTLSVQLRFEAIFPAYMQVASILPAMSVHMGVYRMEHAKVASLMGHMMLRLLILMEEVLPTLDPNAIDYDTRRGGVDKAYSGLGEFLVGLFKVAFIENHAAEPIEITIKNLKEFLPKYVNKLPAERMELIRKTVALQIAPKVRAERQADYDSVMAIFDQ